MSEEESRTLEKNPINQFLYQKSKSDGSDLDSSVVLMMIITSVEMEFLIHFVSNSDIVVQPNNIKKKKILNSSSNPLHSDSIQMHSNSSFFTLKMEEIKDIPPGEVSSHEDSSDIEGMKPMKWTENH